MPRLVRQQLSVARIKALKRPGWHADGGGLYLQISETGRKTWLFRYSIGGRAHGMGLGSIELVSLSEARQRALACRRLLLDGIDPIARRHAAKAAARLEAAKTMTFAACAAAYIEAHRAGWHGAKHAAQWTASLANHAYPILGDLPVQGIDLALVMKVVAPIWAGKTETAARVRARIEAVLDWAAVHGYRTGDNPARWKGHLERLLPAQGAVQRVRHHAALPYTEVAAFIAGLRTRHEMSARAFEFLILTATRTGEVLGATWNEFDATRRVWTISGERMKTGIQHRVPLVGRARDIVLELERRRTGNFVFAHPGGQPFSSMVFLALLRRLGRRDFTPHGFRSSFRDWASERTDIAREVCELALAHSIGSKVEAAYRRGDLFEKRRQLMTSWAKWCDGC